MNNDGSITPHYQRTATHSFINSSEWMNNGLLHPGEVVDIIYPNDPRSNSGIFIEYQVVVVVRNGSGLSSTTYNGCLPVNPFGGGQDTNKFTFRKQTQILNASANTGNGSKVLILCVNGETNSAMIVAGIDDPANYTAESASAGHNWNWTFNGITQHVYDNGQYTFTFQGATISDTTNPNGGTFCTWDTDGGITWDTTTGLQLQLNKSSQSLLLGSTNAVEAVVLGTTYRTAQIAMNNAIVAAAEACAISAAAAASAAPGAAPPNPVLSGAVVTLATAVTTLCTILTSAINSFEGGSAGYLSTVVKSI